MLSSAVKAQKSAAARSKSNSHIVGDGRWLYILGETGSMSDEDLTANVEFPEEPSFSEILGQMPPLPDPSNPGFLTDGSVDPTYGGGSQQGPTPTSTDAWATQIQADQSALAGLPGPSSGNGGYGLPARPTNYNDAVSFMKDPTFGDPGNQSLEDYANQAAMVGDDGASYQTSSTELQAGATPGTIARTVDGSDGLPKADTNFYGSPGDLGWVSGVSLVRVGGYDSHDPLDGAFCGGIVFYTGGFPTFSIGSFTEWFGQYPLASGGAEGSFGSGLENHDEGWWAFFADGGGTSSKHPNRFVSRPNGSSQALVSESIQNNWGPLCGRPDMQILAAPTPQDGRVRAPSSQPPISAGLRFDCFSAGWFWFWDQCPDSYKIPMRALYIHKAQTAWDTAHTAAATAYGQALANLTTDQQASDAFNRQAAAAAAAAQQAIDKQNAANQLAESAAQSQANVLNTQTQAQQQQQQSQLETQEAQLQQQAEAQQLQTQQQQQQLDFQQQQAETQAYQQWLQTGQVPGGGAGAESYGYADQGFPGGFGPGYGGGGDDGRTYQDEDDLESDSGRGGADFGDVSPDNLQPGEVMGAIRFDGATRDYTGNIIRGGSGRY
jgi:hypothetical protein